MSPWTVFLSRWSISIFNLSVSTSISESTTTVSTPLHKTRKETRLSEDVLSTWYGFRKPKCISLQKKVSDAHRTPNTAGAELTIAP